MASVDTEIFKKLARDTLTATLGIFLGKKDLVIDNALMNMLERLMGMTFLRSNDVDRVYKLEQKEILDGCEQRVFLVRPSICVMKKIAAHINADKRSRKLRKYLILAVPRRLHICDLVLEQEGVFGYVQIEELNLSFVPLDVDLISLENDSVLNSFFMEGDCTWLHSVAMSIVNFQMYFGTFQNVCGQGRGAKIVHDLVKTSMNERNIRPANSKIDQLILIDRNVDYTTALCSQLTYEGMLDDIFEIKCGTVTFEKDITNSDRPIQKILNSNDVVFNSIRNMHFFGVFNVCKAKAKEIKVAYDSSKEKSVGELKNFVHSELPALQAQHKSVTLHIGACEKMMTRLQKGTKHRPMLKETADTEHALLQDSGYYADYYNFVEERIHRQSEMADTLRLLCLMSCVCSGLDKKTYKELKEQFLRSYGFRHLITFFNLKKVGLLDELQSNSKGQTTSLSIESNLNRFADKIPAGSSIASSLANLQKKDSFRIVCKKLSLIPREDSSNNQTPKDMSYVFDGAYIPLSCRLVEQAIDRNGWKNLEDVLRHLPGDTFEENQGKSMKGGGGARDHKKTVVVYFIGGVTYTEVAALRYLAKEKKCKIIIAATSILNGKRLIQQFIES